MHLEEVGGDDANGAGEGCEDAVEHGRSGAGGSGIGGSARRVGASARWVDGSTSDGARSRDAAGVRVVSALGAMGRSAGHNSWVAKLVSHADDGGSRLGRRNASSDALAGLRMTGMGLTRLSRTRLGSGNARNRVAGLSRSSLGWISRLAGLAASRSAGRNRGTLTRGGVAGGGRGDTGGNGLRGRTSGGHGDGTLGLADDAADVPGVENLTCAWVRRGCLNLGLWENLPPEVVEPCCSEMVVSVVVWAAGRWLVSTGVKCIRGETTTKCTCTGGDGGWGKGTHESQHAGKGVHLECNHFEGGWKFYGIFISIECQS